jgi:energy-coupling factor transporter transmembrane protein EcfT
MPRHSENQGWILSVGAFVGGELYLSWMQFFPSPLLPLFFLLFIAFSFFLLQGPTRGHCLGVVTRADNVTHEYFRRSDKAGS